MSKHYINDYNSDPCYSSGFKYFSTYLCDVDIFLSDMISNLKVEVINDSLQIEEP